MFVTFIVGRPSPPPNLYCLPLSSSLSSSSSSHHLHHHHYHHNYHHQSSYHLHHLFLRLSFFVIRSYYIIRGSSETQKSRPTSALTRRRQRNVLKTWRTLLFELLFHSIKLPPSFRNSRQLGFHNVKINSRFRLLPENALKLGKTTSLESFPDNNSSRLFPVLSP